MFSQLLLEEGLVENKQAKKIIGFFDKTPVRVVASIEDVFQAVHKPYLAKRRGQSLFLAEKRGTRVRPSPENYGLKGHHYVLMNACNCPYECEYCYLQGYFDSPDIVLYLNQQDFLQDITDLLQDPGRSLEMWFHAGEYGDSLATSFFYDWLPEYFACFAENPGGYLELRTKSALTKAVLNQQPVDNIVTSYTLAPQAYIKRYEKKTASLAARLVAMRKLVQAGHKVAIHLDPIIYHDDVLEAYDELLRLLVDHVPSAMIQYVSLGVVRFTKQVYRQIERNYPGSSLLAAEFIKDRDGKVRYSRPMRLWLLKKVRQLCLQAGFAPEQIYICMEKPTEEGAI